MATIAEFEVPTESFALAEVLPEFPDVVVEADRVAAHVPDSTMPAVWISGDDVEAFVGSVETDRTVATVRASVEFDTGWLLQVGWSDGIEALVIDMIDHEGVILEASGTHDNWQIRIRFMTREQFEAFRRYFDDHGPPFRLTQLFPARHPRHTRGDLTPEQHEALLTATELGYFEVPRAASIEDVAAQLGVSGQAVSERLRRGTDNLVRDVVSVEPIQERT